MLDNSNLNQNSITSTTTEFSSNGALLHTNTEKQQHLLLSPVKPPSLQPSVPRNPRRRLYSRVDRVKSAPPTGVQGSLVQSALACPTSVSDSVSAKNNNNNNTENTKEASEFENTQGSLHREQHDVVKLDTELNDSLNRRVDVIKSGFLLDNEVINEIDTVLNQDYESPSNEHPKAHHREHCNDQKTDQKQNNHISPNFKPQSPNKTTKNNSRYSRPHSSYQISPSHTQNMRSPMYASPPTADGKRSVSKLSFVGEGGQQEIIEYPSRHTIPNPPRSKEAAVYLKSKKVTKSDQKKSMNYFNISASSISIGSRPSSCLKGGVFKLEENKKLGGKKNSRPKTAPNKNRGQEISKKVSDTSIGKMDPNVQRAPLVPTEDLKMNGKK